VPNTEKHFQVIIIGAGVTGTALFYTLSKYTNLNSIAIIEKETEVAKINSHNTKNAQTLHFGDIETHYSAEKAKKVKEAADLVAGYVENYNKTDSYYKNHKLAIGAGAKEIKKVTEHYEEVKHIFPKMKLIDKEEIEKLEPFITKNRKSKQNIKAIYSPDGFAINYSKLSEHFIKDSKENNKQSKSNKILSINLNEKIKKLETIKQNSKNDNKNKNQIFKITSNNNVYTCNILAVCAGAHSLIFAKQLGYGKQFGILPVAGSLFTTNQKFLNGKCYTVQNKKLPFSAIHGDPDVTNQNITRFGPTAKFIPLLERHRYKTIIDFITASALSHKAGMSIVNILADPTLLKYIITNTLYDIPLLGRYLFTKKIQRIIPSIKMSQVKKAKGYGGIRPQIVNVNKKALQMGEAKITGDNCFFSITPSPGASVCLKNAQENTKEIIDWINHKKDNSNRSYKFNEKKFIKDHKRKKNKFSS